MPGWELLAGPAALAVFASFATYVLWREHVRGDVVKDATIKALTDTVAQFPGSLKDLTTVVVAATERERSRP